MASYQNIESTPQGINYLVGDILPWEDYVIFRASDTLSISVYGNKQSGMRWEDATVRYVERITSGYNSYYDYWEDTVDSVSVNIDYPYYAYGNVIGMNYDLPSSNNITAISVSAILVVTVLVSLFRSVFSLRRAFKR